MVPATIPGIPLYYACASYWLHALPRHMRSPRWQHPETGDHIGEKKAADTVFPVIGMEKIPIEPNTVWREKTAPNRNTGAFLCRVYARKHTDRWVPMHSSASTITKNVETTHNKQYIVNNIYSNRLECISKNTKVWHLNLHHKHPKCKASTAGMYMGEFLSSSMLLATYPSLS